MHGEDEGTLTWSEMERQLAESRTEVARLRKIFDDAGQGEHNVLALIEHYQDEERKACHERDEWRTRALDRRAERDLALEAMTKAESERDAYRSMLCDFIGSRWRFIADDSDEIAADMWRRARELLKHGPKETP